MKAINVNSDLLAQALETAGPKITGLTSTLDGISADIRMVEKWLLESAVRFEVSELIEEEDVDGSSRHELVWYGGKDGKTWRLYYRHSWSIRRVDESPYADPQPWWDTGRDERPLIETPVAVRLKSDEPLSRLIKAIAARIPERMTLPRQLSLFN
jgi:hypothetical protein